MINKKENPLNRIKRLSRQTQALEIKTETDNSANKKQTRNLEVCQLRSQGYSLRKIAEELGVSHVRIHQILKEYESILKTQNYDT